MSDPIILREVGLRDGLQLVKRWPSTEAKRAWIDTEYRAGIRHFEVGSFVPENRFPQFADTMDLISMVAAYGDATSAVLAVNKRGAMDALTSGANDITCVVSATEQHSQRNAGRTRDDALRELSDVIELRRAMATGPTITAAIAMAFGCSIEGSVPSRDVVSLATRAVEAGADAIGLADTVGFAGPRQIKDLLNEVKRELPGIPIGIHLHDTRGLGLANAAAAIDAGAAMLDASLGGLGGCPFAPGATGNIATEDVAFLLATMGIAAGLDLGVLIEARLKLESILPEESFPGRLTTSRWTPVQQLYL